LLTRTALVAVTSAAGGTVAGKDRSIWRIAA
jgi:hypothetical protein